MAGPMELHDILQCIKAKDYHSVIIHTEQYVYMGESD